MDLCASDGTMIRNRSSHMPITTPQDAMTRRGNRSQSPDSEKRKGNDEIAQHHRPEQRRIRAGLRGPEDSHLVRAIAVPHREPLVKHEVSPEQAHHKQQLAEILKVQRQQIRFPDAEPSADMAIAMISAAMPLKMAPATK